jgi:hypothetical protein
MLPLLRNRIAIGGPAVVGWFNISATSHGFVNWRARLRTRRRLGKIRTDLLSSFSLAVERCAVRYSIYATSVARSAWSSFGSCFFSA